MRIEIERVFHGAVQGSTYHEVTSARGLRRVTHQARDGWAWRPVLTDQQVRSLGFTVCRDESLIECDDVGCMIWRRAL